MTTSLAPDEWLTVGPHAMRFEAPDIVHLRPGGDVSVADSLALMKIVRELPRPEQGFFNLCDMSKARRQDPAVAHLPESKEYTQSHRAMVFYNATFYHRTLIGIFTRVGKWIQPGALKHPVVVFESEADARAWIAAQREKSAVP